jgi:pimeloyl-ACP methyl ester carboxylesterase
MNNDTLLWHHHGGRGTRTVLLLHGLGATAAVWMGLLPEIEQRGMRWIVADLAGHGESAWRSHYSVGQLAADLAPLIAEEKDVYIIGHSLGTYVGLALASRWFSVRISGVLGIGPKITWSEADLKGMSELAARPVKWYSQESEALARYRRVSGLDEKVAPDLTLLDRGVTHAPEGFRLSQDPRTFNLGGAPFKTLAASAETKVILARGETDGMVSLAELQAHASQAIDVTGAGHNVHAEKPAAVAGLLDQLMS